MNKRGKSRFLIKDKKAMELAIRTIVIIVLAILVLVAVLFIWNQQTRIFSDFLKNLAGKTNVDSLVTSCNSLVGRGSVYEYCCVKREVRYEEAGQLREETLTCYQLSEKSFGERINKLNCQEAGC